MMTQIPRGISEVIDLDIRPMRRKMPRDWRPITDTRQLPEGIKTKAPKPQPLWWRPGGANLLLATTAREPIERKPFMRRVWWFIFQVGLMLAALACAPALGFWMLRVVR